MKTPEHQAAIAGGLCHFAGLPRVELDGDRAVATSYLQIITPDNRRRTHAKCPVTAHRPAFASTASAPTAGSSSARKDGWKVTRRTLRPLDGTDDARALLRRAIAS